MDVLNTKIKSILTEKTTKIRPENIKSGVNILGINGNVTELNGETKTVIPMTSQQTITPTGTGKNALTQVTVNAVTSAIDNNIQAGNIKKDVTILGVTGNYQGTTPSGTLSITENGNYDVTNYASAEVDVSGGGIQATLPDQIKFGTYASTCTDMSWLSDVDTSNITDMARMFYSYTDLSTIASFNTSNVTDMDNAFYGCTSLITAPQMDTSKVTMIRSLFYGCTSLVNVPTYNIESATNFGNMFSNCSNLSNESLNNILAMCATLTASVTMSKTLKKIGLSSTQATTCTGLSNWASAQSAGWTTGY